MYKKGHSQSNQGRDGNKKTKVPNQISKGPQKTNCSECSQPGVKQLMFTHKKCQHSLCFWCAVKVYIKSLEEFQQKKNSSKLKITLFEFKVKTPCCSKSEAGLDQLQKYFTNNCPIDGVKCKSQKYKYWGGIEIGMQCFEQNFANPKNRKIDEKKLDIIEKFCRPQCNGCKRGTKVALQLHICYFIEQKGFCEDCIQTQLERERMVQIKKQELKPQKQSQKVSKSCVKCQKEQVLVLKDQKKSQSTKTQLKQQCQLQFHLAEFEGQSYCHLCLYKEWADEVSQFQKNKKLKTKKCIQLTLKYQQCFLKNCLTCGRQQKDNLSVIQFKNNQVQIQFWAFVCGACKHYLELTINDKIDFIQSFIDYLKHIDQSTEDLQKQNFYFDQHSFLCSQNLKKLQQAKKQLQNSQGNQFSQCQQIKQKQKTEEIYADQFIQQKQENKLIQQQQLTQTLQLNVKKITDEKVDDGSSHQMRQIQKNTQTSSISRSMENKRKIKQKRINFKTELDTNKDKYQKGFISTRNSTKKQEKEQQNNESLCQNQVIDQKCQNQIIDQHESMELKCKTHKTEEKSLQQIKSPQQQSQKQAGQLVKNNIEQSNTISLLQKSNLRSQLDLDLESKQQGISQENNSVSRQHQQGLHQFQFLQLLTDFQKLDQLPPKYQVRLGQKQLAEEIRQSLSAIVLTDFLKQNENDPQQHCMADPFNRNLHQPLPLSCQLCKKHEPILLLEKYCSYCFTMYLIGKAKTIGQPI